MTAVGEGGAVADDGLLREAVRENASWCALVCSSRGVGSHDDGRVWATTGPPPPFYPDAMTLVAGVTADEVLARVGDRASAGVKDSFAEMDLGAAGFDVLFAASWIGLADAVRASRADVREAGGGPPGADVAALEVVRDGAVLGRGTGHRHGPVLGLSGVEADDPELLGEVFRALVRGVRDRFGDLPVVGYERGAELDAAVAQGFAVLGPLRVWARSDRSTSS